MPDSAVQNEMGGTVVVAYVVRVDGSVDPDSIALTQQAPPVLVPAVTQWLLACRFRPATFDGKPMAAKVVRPFNFRVR